MFELVVLLIDNNSWIEHLFGLLFDAFERFIGGDDEDDDDDEEADEEVEETEGEEVSRVALEST